MKLTDPLRYQDVIPNAEAAGIIRYAVGVRTLEGASCRLGHSQTKQTRCQDGGKGVEQSEAPVAYPQFIVF